VDILSTDINYYEINLNEKLSPMKITFQDFKGEAMLFTSTNPKNRYPSFDKYDKIMIIDKTKKEMEIKFEERNVMWYFSLTTEDYLHCRFTVTFRQRILYKLNPFLT
jgi:hypothetical protein